MKLYLAGPMTGIPEHNVPAFDHAAAQLRAIGYEVASPADITREHPQPGIGADGSIDEAAYAILVRLDLVELLDCAAVIVLPGWSFSRGCKLEIAVAHAIGLPVYALGEFLVRGFVHAAPLSITPHITLLGPALNLDLPGTHFKMGEPSDTSGDASRLAMGAT